MTQPATIIPTLVKAATIFPSPGPQVPVVFTHLFRALWPQPQEQKSAFSPFERKQTGAQKGHRLSSGHQSTKKELGCETQGSPAIYHSRSFVAAACSADTGCYLQMPPMVPFLILEVEDIHSELKLETRSKMRPSHTSMFCPLRCFRKKKTSKSNICLFHHLTCAHLLIQAPVFTVFSDSSLWGLSLLQHDTLGTRTQAICL